MIDELKGFDEEVPKWDIALAALSKEEYEKTKCGLTIEDFKRLASKHSIRFDDIMVTMFELVINSEWSYEDAEGNIKPIERDEVDNLYVGGRLHEQDVRQYTGRWRPLN